MRYRNWKIDAFPSYLGYSIQYIAPTGQTFFTSSYFDSTEQALSYARRRIDDLLEMESCRFATLAAAPAR